MRFPQISIAKLLIVVAIVAANLAVGRTLSSCNQETWIGVALGAFASSIGTLLLLRSRAHSRAFWAGFLACSLLVAVVFTESMLSPPTFHFTQDGAEMTDPGSPMWHAWDRYGSTAFELMAPIFGDARIHRDTTIILRAVVWYLPQGSFAMFGGLVSWLIVRSFGHRRQLTQSHPDGGELASSHIPA